MYGEFEHVVRQLRNRNETNSARKMSDDQFDVSDYESDGEVPSMMNRVYGTSRTQRPSLNPLLDTISVIGDLCDSDDAIDGPVTGCLYAGSNSVDSGYKSACPTPDLDNYVQRPAKPPGRPLPADEKAPLDLDHLASLRQTLLTAIERYDLRTKQIERHLETSLADRRPRSVSPANVRLLISEAASIESQGRAEQSAEEQQDGAVRFSRVARCMLEIIEDLQRQQHGADNHATVPATAAAAATVAPGARTSTAGPKVPPKPVRTSLQNKTAANISSSLVSGIPAPATPPRVAKRGRRKLPTPQPPPSDDEEDMKPVQLELSGADYHLYEEIIYDLGPSHAANKNANQPELPPPLPARPSRPQPAKPWLSAIKPFRRDRNNQLVRQNTNQWSATKLHIDRPPRSNNLYTFTSQPSNQCSTSSLKLHHEDEYGFRAPVSHMV